MRCEDYLELLSPYLDNALSLEEQNALEAHLRECSKCQEELDNLKWIKSCLSAVEDKELPTGFHSELMTKVNQDKKQKNSRNKIFTYASSLAAVMILAVVFINQDLKSILPNQMNKEVPESASYTMEKSAVQENEVIDSAVAPRSKERGIGVEDARQGIATYNIASESENKLDMASEANIVLEDNWYITCTDTIALSSEIEEVAKTNGYELQIVIQDTTIYMTFSGNMDREKLKQVIENAKGVEEFLANDPQNDILTLIITQSDS